MEEGWLSPHIVKLVFMGLASVFTVAGVYSLHSAARAEDYWRRRIKGRAWVEEPSTLSRWWALGRPGREKFLEVLGRAIQPNSDQDVSRARRQLLNAGFGESNLLRYFGLQLFLLVLLLALFFPLWAWLWAHGSLLLSGACLMVVASIGYYLPTFGLWMFSRKRLEQIETGFPDAIDLLVLCVESGLSIDASMQRVAEELAFAFPVLSDELRRVVAEERSGLTRQEALRRLNERVQLDDLRQFASVIVQNDALGGSLSQALRAESEAIRRRRGVRAQEEAAKLSVKLIFPVIFCIFPVLLIVLLLPAAIQLIGVFKAVQAP